MIPVVPNGSSRPIVIRGWIVGYAALIHLVWAIVLVFEPVAMNVGPIHQIAEWVRWNNYVASALFFTVGLLAWWGSWHHKTTLTGALLGVPQLFLVWFSAASCIDVVTDGVHPDGTVNGHMFFIAQLAGSILLAPIYSVAVYLPYWKALWTSR